jgi:hypothetical protein
MQRSGTHPDPLVKVSWGELIDKLTILEIKERRLTSPQAIANVRRELAGLRMVVGDLDSRNPPLAQLKDELRAVNEELWEIEDKIRAKEADKDFGEEFVALARSVYFQNDRRGDAKQKINMLMKSDIVEEKKYTEYGRTQRCQ